MWGVINPGLPTFSITATSRLLLPASTVSIRDFTASLMVSRPDVST